MKHDFFRCPICGHRTRVMYVVYDGNEQTEYCLNCWRNTGRSEDP